MDRTTTPIRFFAASLIALCVVLGASIMLPHDRYYRFQAHDNVSTRKADWIYERLHFDPTPIDVALIGTSRIAGGLSGPTIERGYCEATGRRIHVANLAIPMTGRNMHYVIAREAARKKAPALVIVELNDVESRKPHPGFIFLADTREVLTAPVAINLNYVSDLARLPGRQASLFLQTTLRRPAVREKFDADAYAGAHLDHTKTRTAIDGRTASRDITRTRAEMDALLAARQAETNPVWMAPAPLRPLEYRFPRNYLRKIETETRNVGGEPAYVYLPAYGAPEIPAALLRALKIDEAIINLGGAPAFDHTQWLDATHLNARGARAASLRFAKQLSARYPMLGESGACR